MKEKDRILEELTRKTSCLLVKSTNILKNIPQRWYRNVRKKKIEFEVGRPVQKKEGVSHYPGNKEQIALHNLPGCK